MGLVAGRGGGIRTHDFFVPKITARVSGVAVWLKHSHRGAAFVAHASPAVPHGALRLSASR